MSTEYGRDYDMASSKTVNMRNSDLINATEARKLLGISANKMAALIGSGTIPFEQDPLDHRVKLVSRKDVEKLMQRSNHSRT
jgi:hypothetical protein